VGGAPPGTGGTLSSGGVTAASGGRQSSGGQSYTTGGRATGGTSTGGVATGGKASGGTATGGKASGGTATGGKATGGSATGGAGGTVPSSGCGKSPTLQNGTITITSSGATRQYIIDIPTNYTNTTPYRLVFGFHWVGGTMTDVATGQTVTRDVWAYYGLKRLANNSTVFVAPQGINNGWGQGNADLVFVDDMITQIGNALCIDKSRLFAIGFSYGGAMSHALACARATVFRGVAVQDAGAISGCSGGTSPIAYFIVHGVRDTVFPIATGQGLRDRFVTNNGCTPQTVTNVANGSLTHGCTKYQGCSSDHPVEWCSFDEGHIAAPRDGATGDNGNTTWVPGEAWAFFTQF
jgi:poly(3-hydroxybutyrate) depolymerase